MKATLFNHVSMNIFPLSSTEPSRKYLRSKSKRFSALPVLRSTLRSVDSPFWPVVSMRQSPWKKSPWV